jgi:meso-butanediol dehydrogenase / (S,S)-butanediol dehydrogenase / diacetyl reductase
MKRVVLVTGGGSGIGAAVAAARDADTHVVVCGRRADSLDLVARRTGAQPRVADVSSPATVRSLVEDIVTEHGRLDGVVANAGVLRPGGVADLSLEDWEATLRTNLTSVFVLAQAALPHLVAAGGALVAVSSVAALRAFSGAAAYAASKAGLVMLTQSVAVEYGPRGVRANVVCPGWIRT